MKVIGYTRTRLTEDLGAEDLEEQERSIAEFCRAQRLQLTHVLADESGDITALNEALNGNADGIVVTDPLVLADDIDGVCDLAIQLAEKNKHLFIVCHEQHICPQSLTLEQELIDSSLSLLNRRVS